MESDSKKDYKTQKQNYRMEKKRVAAELLTTLKDPTVVVMADWLKLRSTLRKWTRLYVVLKPGLLILYKSPKTHKQGYWVGTVLLSTCQLIERPSKKDGFCFKLFHPLDQSIWATRGPHGETIPAVSMPLPSSYLMCRATEEDAGRCWMDALELALRCSSLLMRTMHRELRDGSTSGTVPGASLPGGSSPSGAADSANRSLSTGGGTTFTDGGTTPSAETIPQSRHSAYFTYSSPYAGDGSGDSSATPHHRRNSSGPTQGPSISPRTSSDDGILKEGDVDLSILTGGPGSVHHHHRPNLDDAEAEKHFSQEELGIEDEEATESDEGPTASVESDKVEETIYVPSPPEVFGTLGDAEQTEEVADENKSLIWGLMKQVRPGMDLSKVVLPTFILEPRSFLEKFADYYYHSDILKDAVQENDPFKRMKAVVKFYLSGFYKKPKGLKKPYNPILGEVFRCRWDNPHDDSRTFYITEQVSHHPPVSAFFLTNRKSGYNISGTILAKSKFYGNSLSAVMIGSLQITLLGRGETYVVTLPYAHCKGLILGTLTMELGGSVAIHCDRTGYSTNLEFKLRPWLGGPDTMNAISGKIKLGKECLAEIHGNWDSTIRMQDKIEETKSVLWLPSQTTIDERLQRLQVPVEKQQAFESEKMWSKVTEALEEQDQYKATDEKTVLEEAQRSRARELKAKGADHQPKLFEFDENTGRWLYKYADYRPWDPSNDLQQYEQDLVIRTKVRRKAPPVRSGSMVSGVEDGATVPPSVRGIPKLATCGQNDPLSSEDDEESRASTVDLRAACATGLNKRGSKMAASILPNFSAVAGGSARGSLAEIRDTLADMSERVTTIQRQLTMMNRTEGDDNKVGFGGISLSSILSPAALPGHLVVLCVFMALQAILIVFYRIGGKSSG